MKRNTSLRSTLLAGASIAVVGFGSPAFAGDPPYTTPSVNVTGATTLNAQQSNGTYEASPAAVTLGANTDGVISVVLNSNDPDVYALSNGTVTVGTTGAGNTASATGYANTASLALELTSANTLTGSGSATVLATANSASPGPVGATVTATDDLGVHVTQQNNGVAATVTNATQMVIALDHGAENSTITQAGNATSGTGVLNSANSSFTGANVNASTASVGFGSAQSSVDSSLSVTVGGLNLVTTADDDDVDTLVGSTLSLTDNSQTATAVANSGSNTQSLTGTNALALDGGDPSSFLDMSKGTYFAKAGATDAQAVAGFATASRQESVDTDVAAGVDNSVDASFVVGLSGGVAGSTVNNDRNTSTALAHANEVSNSTTLAANSIATGTLETPVSGTVAAIASVQSVDGESAITAALLSGYGNSPSVLNSISGDVSENSTVTASANTIKADAAGNAAANGVAASATTIATTGAEPAFAHAKGEATANAAFAVANQQSVGALTAITASLVGTEEGEDGPQGGVSVTTAIGGGVADSSVASNGNKLLATALGNGMLRNGNTLDITGTNLAPTAAIASSQTMAGTVRAVIGSAPIAGGQGVQFSVDVDIDAGVATGSLIGKTDAEIAAFIDEHDSLPSWNYDPDTKAFTYSAPDTGSTTLAATVPEGDDQPFTVPATITAGVATGDLTSYTQAQRDVFIAEYSAQPGWSYDSGTYAFSYNTAGSGAVTLPSTVEGAPEDPFNVAVTKLNGVASGSLDGYSAERIAAFKAAHSSLPGWDYDDEEDTFTYTYDSSGSDTLAASVPTAASPASGGVLVLVGADITNSSVDVRNNKTAGSATGNNAVSTLTVAATNAVTNGDRSSASARSVNDEARASADAAVANNQTVVAGATVESQVAATFGVDTTYLGAETSSDVVNSTVAVSGNAQSSTVTGNVASNTVALSAGSVASTSALANNQRMAGTLRALTGLPAIEESEGEEFSVDVDIDAGVATGSLDGRTDAQIAAFIAAHSSLPSWSYDAGTKAFTYSAPDTGSLNLDSEVPGGPGEPEPFTVPIENTAGVISGSLASFTQAQREAIIAAYSGKSLWEYDSINHTFSFIDILMITDTTIGANAPGPDTDPEPFTVPVTKSNGVASGNLSSYTSTEVEVFLSQYDSLPGWTYDDHTGEFSYTYDAPDSDTLEATAPGTGRTISGGALAVVEGDILGSTVRVDGNSITGSTTGNAATNLVSVRGGQAIEDANSGRRADTTPHGILGRAAYASADHSLSNVQELDETAGLSTSVNGAFTIATAGNGAPTEVEGTSDVIGSTLSVSGNTQQATTTGNLANSTVALAGGSMSTNAALQSLQLSYADGEDEIVVGADSTMVVSAPAANTGSTLAMNGNANSAAATVNDATNTMTVKADNDLASNYPRYAWLDGNHLYAPDGADYAYDSADYVVNNAQGVTTGIVDATATTTIGNNDMSFVDTFETDGIDGSLVAVNGNTTSATAISNRADNLLSLSANSSGVSGGVLNHQGNGAAVTANASTLAGVVIEGSEVDGTPPVSLPPVINSAVAVNGNATTARAGGNSAANALNAAATSFADNSGVGTAYLNQGLNYSGSNFDEVKATFAVLNEQANNGAIVASATVTYGASFGAIGDGASVVQSAVAVNGNSANAVAYGNAASNSLTLNALNSPASGIFPTTAVVASNQVNTGNIAAVTTQSDIALNAGAWGGNVGPVSQSSLSVNGNALGAAAYGNSVTNTMTIGGANLNVTGQGPV